MSPLKVSFKKLCLPLLALKCAGTYCPVPQPFQLSYLKERKNLIIRRESNIRIAEKSHFCSFFGKDNSCMKGRLPYVRYKRYDLIPLTFYVVCFKITYSDPSVLPIHMNVLQEGLGKKNKNKNKNKNKKPSFRMHEILK